MTEVNDTFRAKDIEEYIQEYYMDLCPSISIKIEGSFFVSLYYSVSKKKIFISKASTKQEALDQTKEFMKSL